MKTWVLSIIGTVILITIAEMLLPSGRMKNVTRSIFGVLVMIAVLKPLPSLRNAEFNLDFDYQINSGFLNSVNARKVGAMEQGGVDLLSSLGFKNGVVKLSGDWAEGKFMIRSVLAYADDPLNAEVVKRIADYYDVKENVIVSSLAT